MAVVAVGCSSTAPPREQASGTSAPPTTTTAPVTTTTTPSSTAPASEVGAALPDGRHFGYVRRVDARRRTLEFDLAYFLTGAEADEAARKDGVVGPGEHVENDFYIVNRNPRIRTLAVSPGAHISVLDNVGDPSTKTEVTLDAFASYFRSPGDDRAKAGYWVTLREVRVATIELQYVP